MQRQILLTYCSSPSHKLHIFNLLFFWCWCRIYWPSFLYTIYKLHYCIAHGYPQKLLNMATIKACPSRLLPVALLLCGSCLSYTLSSRFDSSLPSFSCSVLNDAHFLIMQGSSDGLNSGIGSKGQGWEGVHRDLPGSKLHDVPFHRQRGAQPRVQLLPGQRGRLHHHLLEGRDSGEMPKNLIAGSFVWPNNKIGLDVE